jgi:hypothetical protein
MIFRKEPHKDPDLFWREFEEQTGEKVLDRGLGQYLSGWDPFDAPGGGGKPVWGLIIATDGGFRFHHFPQVSWLDSLIRPASGGGAGEEKTFFIPKDRIISAELRREKRWWKRLAGSAPPLLTIRYHTGAGEERELLIQAEYRTEGLAERLKS